VGGDEILQRSQLIVLLGSLWHRLTLLHGRLFILSEPSGCDGAVPYASVACC
jgi:hypothetical protein